MSSFQVDKKDKLPFSSDLTSQLVPEIQNETELIISSTFTCFQHAFYKLHESQLDINTLYSLVSEKKKKLQIKYKPVLALTDVMEREQNERKCECERLNDNSNDIIPDQIPHETPKVVVGAMPQSLNNINFPSYPTNHNTSLYFWQFTRYNAINDQQLLRKVKYTIPSPRTPGYFSSAKNSGLVSISMEAT